MAKKTTKAAATADQPKAKKPTKKAAGKKAAKKLDQGMPSLAVGKPKKKLSKKAVKALSEQIVSAPTDALAKAHGVEQIKPRTDVVLLHTAPGSDHQSVVIGAKATKTAPEVVVARVARTQRTLAQRMGSELVRYLRIHSKHPYGKRGEKAILDLAKRVAAQAKAEAKQFQQVLQPEAVPFVEQAIAELEQKHADLLTKSESK